MTGPRVETGSWQRVIWWFFFHFFLSWSPPFSSFLALSSFKSLSPCSSYIIFCLITISLFYWFTFMVLDLAHSEIRKTDNKQTNEGTHITHHCKCWVCIGLGAQRKKKKKREKDLQYRRLCCTRAVSSKRRTCTDEVQEGALVFRHCLSVERSRVPPDSPRR